MSWRYQEQVYVVMWQSPISDATLTEVRRTDAGRDRLIETLVYNGIPRSSIIVTPMKKKWMPDGTRDSSGKEGTGKEVSGSDGGRKQA